ncbi:protein containing FOG: WD40 repeat [Bellilinea caldifistulae]|uniref:Uncharacterized protein n=1 Tax=Bellilinea caldifistulae TaxID=360411 RepID=A0A0N8GMY6_9CHLR|nr:WD40 repeat domain-containing protein [Bellilinea caldifistulae]KPL76602.1 hypothetical protein AC812_04570 [Bellilinea caldifistulae]GAP12170.1 protein containing FOG: WD40 repeat [Bellilinea caldifistulae]
MKREAIILQKIIFIFISIITLSVIASCQRGAATLPADLATTTLPVATEKPTLTFTITSSPTITPAPTYTPTVTLTPTITPTPLPWARTVLNSGNARQLTLLTHWGYGSIQQEEKVGPDRILIKSTAGVYLFRESDKKMIAEYYGAIRFLGSPDKEKASIRFPDGSLLLIQLEDGNVIHSFPPLGDIPSYLSEKLDETQRADSLREALERTDLVFSPDSRFLACGYADFSIGVWNVETGELKAKLYSDLTGYSYPYQIMFIPDGTHLASMGGRLIYWSLENEKALWYINNAWGSLDIGLISPDFNVIGYSWYSASDNRYRIHLINSRDGSTIAKIGGVASQKPFSPDSKLFVTTLNGNINIDQVQPRYVRLRTLYTNLESAVAEFSEDGSKIIVNGGELVYSVPDFNLISEGSPSVKEDTPLPRNDSEEWLSLGFGWQPRGVIALPENQVYIWGGWNPIWRWNPLTRQMDWVSFSEGLLTAPVISSDGAKVAGCFMDRLEVWSFEKEAFTISTPCRKDSVLAFLPGTDILAIGRGEKITLFDILKGEKIQDFIFSDGYSVGWLDMSPGGKFFASGGSICGFGGCRGDIRLWQVDPPRGLSLIPEGSEKAVEDVVFTSDESEIIVAKGYVWLWNVMSGSQDGKLPLFGHKLAISPNDTLVAVSREGGEVSLVTMETRQIVGNIRITASDVIDLAFTPDGANLLILGNNGVLEVWGVQ